jgi:hypothetical protein
LILSSLGVVVEEERVAASKCCVWWRTVNNARKTATMILGRRTEWYKRLVETF